MGDNPACSKHSGVLLLEALLVLEDMVAVVANKSSGLRSNLWFVKFMKDLEAVNELGVRRLVPVR